MCFMARLKSAMDKKQWAKAKAFFQWKCQNNSSMVAAYIDYEQVLTVSTTECKTKEEM